MSEAYRPSNGTEGDWFERKFCIKCEENRKYMESGEYPCEIQGLALALPVDDEAYPKEWVRDDDGPKCTAFRPLGSGTAEQFAKDKARYEQAMAEMRAAQGQNQ